MTVDDVLKLGVSKIRPLLTHCDIDGCFSEAIHEIDLDKRWGYGNQKTSCQVCSRHYLEISQALLERRKSDGIR